MMSLFRKPTCDDIKRQQLAEAERCHAIYSAEQERMAAHAEMYNNRIQRLKAELSSKGESSDCKAQFIGLKECKCGSTKTSKITVSGTQPDWFNADSK